MHPTRESLPSIAASAVDVADIERRISRKLSVAPSALQNEEKLQSLIATVLTDAGIEFEREKRLGEGERLDFYLKTSGIAIEIKKRSAGLPALSQVGRYLSHSEVTGAIIIAIRFTETIETMEGKPVRFIPLWKFSL